MANELSLYYDRGESRYRDFKSYMGELASQQTAAIDRQAAVQEAGFAGVNSTLNAGFAGVSNQLGELNASFSAGVARIAADIDKMSDAVCAKLDELHDVLNNPLLTQAREFYRRAAVNNGKGFYEEALEDLKQALEKNKTDYISWFLLGKVYLFGAGEFSNVISLDSAINALTTAGKYISPDFNANRPGKIGTSPASAEEIAQLLASEIRFYMGLAKYYKSNELYAAEKTEEARALLADAQKDFERSCQYSDRMVESRYNVARCKALLDDKSGALADLEAAIKEDAAYSEMVKKETDFDAISNEYPPLIERMKAELYKEALNWIQSVYTKSQPAFSADISMDMSYFVMRTRYDGLRRELAASEAAFQTEVNNDGSVTIFAYVQKDTDFLKPVSGGFVREYSTSVVIPAFINGKPVTGIGNSSFAKKMLNSVVIPNGVISIGDNAFYGNYLKSAVIPDGVTRIGENAFSSNHLTSVVIPNGVTRIGENAFSGNSLSSVVIPSGVTGIGKEAFDKNNLTSITIGANVELEDGSYDSRHDVYEEFVSYYNSNGKLADTYTCGTDSTGRSNGAWSCPKVRIPLEAKRRQEAERMAWSEKYRRREAIKEAVWKGLGIALGLALFILGIVVGVSTGHTISYGIMCAVAGGIVALAFTARGWGILALALVIGGIALGNRVGHPYLLGLIGIVSGVVLWWIKRE
jgi:tetratricopeptide (TPR) repeat protein